MSEQRQFLVNVTVLTQHILITYICHHYVKSYILLKKGKTAILLLGEIMYFLFTYSFLSKKEIKLDMFTFFTATF